MLVWIIVTGIVCILYSEWMAHRAQKNALAAVQEIVTRVIVPLAAQVQDLKQQVAHLEAERANRKSKDAA